MNQKGESHAKEKIPNTMGANISVNHRVGRHRAKEKKVSQRGKDNGGADREQKFAPVIPQGRKFCLNFPERPFILFEVIEDKKRDGGQNYVPDEYDQYNYIKLVAKAHESTHGPKFGIFLGLSEAGIFQSSPRPLDPIN